MMKLILSFYDQSRTALEDGVDIEALVALPVREAIRRFKDTLPEQVEVDGKSYPLQVVRINTRSGSNNEILQAFFEAYQVPEEDQMVPIVFTSQGYLAGYEDITQNLLPQLEAGAGLNFQYPG